MGSIQVSHVGWRRPGGAELLRDVSFTVGNGERVALVGANGVGKTTLLRLIAGDDAPTTGHDRHRRPARRDAPARRPGRRHRARPDGLARPGAAAAAPPRAPGRRAEAAAAADPMRYADRPGRVGRRRRLRRRGVLGRVLHSRRSASRSPTSRTARCAPSAAASRSGSRSRPCCAATSTSCCSTSRTTSSTCPASAGSRRSCGATRKTVLYVSHDRELLAATATKVVTVEASGSVDARRRLRHATTRPARRTSTGASTTLAVYEDERKQARGARRRDAPAGQDQRHLRPAAEGRREPAAPVPRSERPPRAGPRAEDRHAPRAGHAPASGR